MTCNQTDIDNLDYFITATHTIDCNPIYHRMTPHKNFVLIPLNFFIYFFRSEDIHFVFYKNHEAQNRKKIKNIIRIMPKLKVLIRIYARLVFDLHLRI